MSPLVEKYVHIVFTPKTIQNIRPARPTEPISPRAEITATPYHARGDFHLYLASGQRDSPSFIVGEFDVQRLNREWVAVPLQYGVLNILPSAKVNRAAGVQRHPFPPDYTVLIFDSSRSDHKLDGHLQILLGMEDGQFNTMHDETFPMVAQIFYTQKHSNTMASISHWKMLEGTGQRLLLSPAERPIVERYLKLVHCERHLARLASGLGY